MIEMLSVFVASVGGIVFALIGLRRIHRIKRIDEAAEIEIEARHLRGIRVLVPPERRHMSDEQIGKSLGFTDDWPPPEPKAASATVCYWVGEGNPKMSGHPPFRLPGCLVPSRKVTCEGCGAPLHRNEIECSYCGRDTGLQPPSRPPKIPQPTPTVKMVAITDMK